MSGTAPHGGDGEVEILSGGVIDVDTDRMRQAAAQMAAVSMSLWRAASAVGRASNAMADSTLSAKADFSGLGGIEGALHTNSEQIQTYANNTRLMADAFEYADLLARQRSLDVHYPAQADALQSRIDELLAADPQVVVRAERLMAQREGREYDGTRLPWEVALLGEDARWAYAIEAAVPGFAGAALMLNIAFPFLQRGMRDTVRKLGRGVMVPGETLSPKADPAKVLVKQLPVAAATGAPSTVRSAVARVPADSAAQVRIERYSMADGSRRFRLYLDGTQALAGDDPWNMESNLDMYVDRQQGASSAATLEAMRQAGVQPGDTLDLVTYSQSGMIGAEVAMSGDYDVRTYVSVGSPVEPTLDEGTQLVTLRNDDDPVGNGLTGGGSAGSTGSDDSFIARRDAGGWDPSGPSLDDLRMIEPHLFSRYLDTAALVDDSGDPRVVALYENWAEYDEATEVETFLFTAEIDRDG